MDFTLRCNSLKCRRPLDDRAVVTTCSHIFCVECSVHLGLSNTNAALRICPACDTTLPNPDDVVETRLDPSEDYKTSVLSGLSPTIIIECAGRALAFYSYQTTQEIIYQEYLAKSLTEKYTTLNSQIDKIVHDANIEIESLQNKLAAVQLEQKRLEDENHKIIEAFREKSRSQAQLNKMYQTLKAQVLVGQVATAASDNAEATLQSATGERLIDRIETRNGAQPTLSVDHSSTRVHRRQRSGSSSGREAYRAGHSGRLWGRQQQNNRLFTAENGPSPRLVTPSHHRTRLGEMNAHGADPVFNPASTIARQPLNNLPLNSIPGIGGYGLSSGMRTSKQMNASVGGTSGWSHRDRQKSSGDMR